MRSVHGISLFEQIRNNSFGLGINSEYVEEASMGGSKLELVVDIHPYSISSLYR
jgi:hypothetical protein